MPQVVTIGQKRYDVDILREEAEKIPIVYVKLSRINYNINSKIWRDQNGKFSVGEVIRNRFNPRFANHFDRIKNADLNYPILINKKYKILDGYHRYNHARLFNKEEIPARIITQEILEKAEIIMLS
jgi:hypothetical protein